MLIKQYRWLYHYDKRIIEDDWNGKAQIHENQNLEIKKKE